MLRRRGGRRSYLKGLEIYSPFSPPTPPPEALPPCCLASWRIGAGRPLRDVCDFLSPVFLLFGSASSRDTNTAELVDEMRPSPISSFTP